MFAGDFPLFELTLPDEALALVDRTLFERQERAALDARDAEDMARQDLASAEAEWGQAHEALTALHLAAMAGRMPELSDRKAAEERVALADTDAKWHRKVWEQTRALCERAQAEFAAARQEAQKAALVPWGEQRLLLAWAGAVERAARIDRVLAHASEVSVARQTRAADMRAQPWRTEWPDLNHIVEAVDGAMIEARQELQDYIEGAGAQLYNEGFRALHCVGALRPNMPRWPASIEDARRMDEAAMRRHFDRPREGESFAAPRFDHTADPIWAAHIGNRIRARRRA